jgi:hypothetical protein
LTVTESINSEEFHNPALRSTSRDKSQEMTTCCILPCIYLLFYRKVASLLFLKTKDFVFCFLQKVKDHFVKSSSRWAFVLICGCKDMAFIFKRQIFEQLFFV